MVDLAADVAAWIMTATSADASATITGRAATQAVRQRPPATRLTTEAFSIAAGDEVRSWFGDDEAERRREYDDYMDRRYGDPREQHNRIGYADRRLATAHRLCALLRST